LNRNGKLSFQVAEAQKALDIAKNESTIGVRTAKASNSTSKQKKQLIAKYALQQFQTRKNGVRALAHEIEQWQEEIRKIEDSELELMEQAETAQRDVGASKSDRGRSAQTGGRANRPAWLS